MVFSRRFILAINLLSLALAISAAYWAWRLSARAEEISAAAVREEQIHAQVRTRLQELDKENAEQRQLIADYKSLVYRLLADREKDLDKMLELRVQLKVLQMELDKERTRILKP